MESTIVELNWKITDPDDFHPPDKPDPDKANIASSTVSSFHNWWEEDDDVDDDHNNNNNNNNNNNSNSNNMYM